MKQLNIDRTKIKKISTYAKEYGITTSRVYQLEKEGKIKVIKLDGIKFVQL